MTDIITAAYESVQNNQRVRLPRSPIPWKGALMLLIGLSVGGVAALAGGGYLHLYWKVRNPPPVPEVKVVQPDTFVSDVHYVYTTKALPVTPNDVTDLKNALFSSDSLLNPLSAPPERELPELQESALMTPPASGGDDVAAKLREKLAVALREQSREYRSEVPQGAMSESASDDSAASDGQPDVLRQRLPYLKYQSHLFSSDGKKSRVKLNNHLYQEGDSLARDVVIKKITTDQLIVGIDGNAYALPALKDWKP